MKKIFFTLVLSSLVTASCGTSDEIIEPDEADEAETTLSPISESIKTVYTEALDCTADSMDLYRNWCAATEIGTADFSAPDVKTSYLGFSMIYDPTQGVVTGSLETTRLSVLHLDGESALITDITPSNDEEEQQLLQMTMSLADNLKNGFAGDFALNADLYDYIMNDQQTRAAYPMTVNEDGKSATYEAGLPSELYYVPNAGYVAIEDNGDGRAYVSIFSLASLIKE